MGTGHLTAFCRAALARCATPFKEISDESGRISVEKLRKDPGLQCSPWEAEWTWEDLPDLAQKALNVAHSVSMDHYYQHASLQCCVFVRSAL